MRVDCGGEEWVFMDGWCEFVCGFMADYGVLGLYKFMMCTVCCEFIFDLV